MEIFTKALVYITLAIAFSSVFTLDTNNNRLLQETEKINVLCPSIDYFRPADAKNKGGLDKVEANSNGDFCPKVKNLCCSDSDFANIKHWWQEDVSFSDTGKTRSNLRKQKLLGIMGMQKALLGSLKAKSMMKLMAMTKKTSRRLQGGVAPNVPGWSETCNAALKDLTTNMPNPAEMTTYWSDAAKCWNWTNTFQTTVLCGVCDPEAHGSIDIANQRITVSSPVLKKFSDACASTINMNVNKIHPALTNLDKLVRCATGKLTGTNLQWPNNHLSTFNGTVDATMVPTLLGFAENLNVNTEGSVTYLAKLIQRVVKFVAPAVSKKAVEAKVEEKKTDSAEDEKKEEKRTLGKDDDDEKDSDDKQEISDDGAKDDDAKKDGDDKKDDDEKDDKKDDKKDEKKEEKKRALKHHDDKKVVDAKTKEINGEATEPEAKDDKRTLKTRPTPGAKSTKTRPTPGEATEPEDKDAKRALKTRPTPGAKSTKTRPTPGVKTDAKRELKVKKTPGEDDDDDDEERQLKIKKTPGEDDDDDDEDRRLKVKKTPGEDDDDDDEDDRILKVRKTPGEDDDDDDEDDRRLKTRSNEDDKDTVAKPEGDVSSETRALEEDEPADDDKEKIKPAPEKKKPKNKRFLALSKKIPHNIRAQAVSGTRRSLRDRILMGINISPDTPKDAQFPTRMLRLISGRRLAEKKKDNVKSNGQCKCGKTKKSKDEKKKEMYQDRTSLLMKRMAQSWDHCEFQKSDDTRCDRKDKNYCEFVKKDDFYGKNGKKVKYTKTVDSKKKTVELSQWQNQVFTKWRCVSVKKDGDDDFKYNPLKDDDEEKLKNNTIFFCKDSDGDKHGKNDVHDINEDIKWGAGHKKGNKPTADCKCLKVKDIPYSIIKKFKDITYPKYEKFPKNGKWKDKKASKNSIDKVLEPKVIKYLDELQDNVTAKGYEGDYDSDKRRRLMMVGQGNLRNRILYTIPYSSTYWMKLHAAKLKIKKLEQERNLKVRKQSRSRLNRKLAEVSVLNADGKTAAISGVMVGKAQNDNHNNKHDEVHANTYQMDSVSPDGLSTVSRQVADVVTSTNESSEIHSNQVKAVGKKVQMQAQKINASKSTDDGNSDDEDSDNDDDDSDKDDDEEEKLERNAKKEEPEDTDDQDEEEEKVDRDLDDNSSDDDSEEEADRELISENIKQDLKRKANEDATDSKKDEGTSDSQNKSRQLRINVTVSVDEELKYSLEKIWGDGKLEMPEVKDNEGELAEDADFGEYAQNSLKLQANLAHNTLWILAATLTILFVGIN